MMLVDYAGSIFPIIAHSPWNGLHLADFVMPFFLFVAGVSLAIVYKVYTLSQKRSKFYIDGVYNCLSIMTEAQIIDFH